MLSDDGETERVAGLDRGNLLGCQVSMHEGNQTLGKLGTHFCTLKQRRKSAICLPPDTVPISAAAPSDGIPSVCCQRHLQRDGVSLAGLRGTDLNLGNRAASGGIDEEVAQNDQ